MSEIVSFGEWAQKRRNQLGYSRTVLAKQIGCAPITIKKIERDERRPSEEMAELFAQHLQIPDESKDDFIRRARGEFVPRFGSPDEMSLAEAKSPVAGEVTPKHNLPPQTTPFLGREVELAEIAQNFSDPNCRLLTILGAGGMGKTRLSIEVAKAELDNFTDGVAYVTLAPIKAADDGSIPLVGPLADVLDISFHGNESPEQQLLNYLKRKEMLIVFDNFEHLVESSVFLNQLLIHAPDIVILATSRERLGLSQEWLYPLKGLSFSLSLEQDSLSQEAVQLFHQRAKQVRPSFDLEKELPDVLQICQQVEGMPLGLELAAAWVQQLSCADIAKEIAAEIDFLSSRFRQGEERHRSLRAVFSYSWQHLSRKEQTTLQKLSVFRNGFDRNAAAEIAGASLLILSSLVDRSLLAVEESGRYQIHELLRQFAAEKLDESLDDQMVSELHAHYFFSFLSKQEARVKGAEGIVSFGAIEQNIDNIRAAVQWAIKYDRSLFNRSVGFVLWIFYETQGWFKEGEAVFKQILASLKVDCDATSSDKNTITPPCLYWAQYSSYLGGIQFRLGSLQQALQTLHQSLALMPAEDKATRWGRGMCLWFYGIAAQFDANFSLSFSYLAESRELFKAEKDLWGYAAALSSNAQTAHICGQYDDSQNMLEEAEEILIGMNEQVLRGYNLNDQGRLAAHRGDFTRAKEFHQAALAHRKKTGTRSGVTFTTFDLGLISRLQGDFESARAYFRQAIELNHEANMLDYVQECEWELGNLAIAEGDFAAAKYYFSKYNLKGLNRLGGTGWAFLGLGELEKARKYFCARLQDAIASQAKPLSLDTLVGMAHLKSRAGLFGQAIELLTLVKYHAASTHEIKEKARLLREELAAELSPELVAEAEARGRELDLFETAEDLLAEGNLTSNVGG